MTTQPYSQTQEVEEVHCALHQVYQSAQNPSLDTAQTPLGSKRHRGVVLSVLGFKRLQAAIKQAEQQENYGEHFTQQQLGERMGVSTKTISRLWSVTGGLDQRTLKLCFSAFNLELHKQDYTTLGSFSDSNTAVEAQMSAAPVVDVCLHRYPSGPEPLDSIFYIPRPPIEELAHQEISQRGCFLRIKAAKEMGKSSLLYRVLAGAMTLGYQTVHLDMNRVDACILTDVSKFLRWFCKSVSRELNLDANLDEYWDEELGSKLSCSLYLQAYLLPRLETPLVLALNEINRIFAYPELAQEFLPLLRSWQESAKQEQAWQKLRLVIVYSTEIYIPLDINQSPCNVGLPLKLPEFSGAQVQQLALRHGLNWQGNQAQQLMAMVGGHPALVRIALYHLCRQEMTLSQLLQQASTEAGIYSAHLRRHLNLLREKPELAVALEAVLTAEQSIYLEPIVAYQLESQGLVNINLYGVTISRELYRLYFLKHLLKR